MIQRRDGTLVKAAPIVGIDGKDGGTVVVLAARLWHQLKRDSPAQAVGDDAATKSDLG